MKKNAQFLGQTTMRNVLFGDTPYGRFITEKSIKKIKLKDIKDYYNNYSPNVSELVVVGNINQAEIYKELDFLAESKYSIGWVGKKIPPKNYITCNKDKNIFSKEKHYSELTFHYWYWKNKLDLNDKNWLGFCQKRRYWIKKNSIEGLSSGWASNTEPKIKKNLCQKPCCLRI